MPFFVSGWTRVRLTHSTHGNWEQIHASAEGRDPCISRGIARRAEGLLLTRNQPGLILANPVTGRPIGALLGRNDSGAILVALVAFQWLQGE